MADVRIKAVTAFSHGYEDSDGNLQRVELDTDQIGSVDSEIAKELHEKGLVQVAASDADKIENEE